MKVKPRFIVLFGALAVLAGLLSYPLMLFSRKVVTPEFIAVLEFSAYVSSIIVFTGLFCIGFVLSRIKNAEASLETSIISMVSRVMVTASYARVWIASTIVYSLFYSFVSGMLVYQPLNFSDIYSVKVPSVSVAVCCGSLGEVPKFAIYATEHLGILVTPLHIVLLFLVSSLVGLNASLALYAYRNRPQNVRNRWFWGLGAIVGLFTACPSCASLWVGAVLGGGAVATAFVTPLWMVFALVSIPLLIMTPYLTLKGLLNKCCP